MDYQEVVSIATEQALNDLISGKEFRGLGPLAKQLVMFVATPANENAIALHGNHTIRTAEYYAAMVDKVTKRFVLDITGLGDSKPKSIHEAVNTLVEEVYRNYQDWAESGKRLDDIQFKVMKAVADMRACSNDMEAMEAMEAIALECFIYADTPENRKAAMVEFSKLIISG